MIENNKTQEIQMIMAAFERMGANTQQLADEKARLEKDDAYLTDWLEYLWCEEQAEKQENKLQQFPGLR